MEGKARARIDVRTKNLAKRIKQGEIAVIDHADLDQVSADSLVKAKVRLVINASRSMTGRYPNPGPAVLLQNGIEILDNIGRPVFDKIREGDILEIRGAEIWRGQELLGTGTYMDLKTINHRLREVARTC